MIGQRYWFQLEPVDTLFFRGAEGMEAGENHEVDTMFPPLPDTICGALRSAVMVQNQINPADFLNTPAGYTHLPLLGTPERPGFSVTGPLFMVKDEPLFPAPANWFVDKKVLRNTADGGSIQVETSRPLVSTPLGLCGGASTPFWIHRPAALNLVPLVGYWVTAGTIQTAGKDKFNLTLYRDIGSIAPGVPALIEPGVLFCREARTGIALTDDRTARQGHLYSSVHIRMSKDVALIFAIDRDPSDCLAQNGILQLGGEQRVCRYQMTQELLLPSAGTNGLRLALGPVPTDLIPASVPRAAGKIIRVGGWDMCKGFHKPMRGYFPAGSVFAADLDDQQFIVI